MCGIQNVTRKQGIYYYRRLIRLGADKPFRLRLSLRTTSRKRAALLAAALTLIGERVAMTMMANIARDGLTGPQRAEIYRQQMLVERDRLEVMHANLSIVPPEDHDDIEKALMLRLGAGEMAARDGMTRGKIEDFLVARVNVDDDDESIVVMAWSDLASSLANESPDEDAAARLADLGIDQSMLNATLTRKIVHQARIEAIREFRDALANPGTAYPAVPLAGFEPARETPAQSSIPGQPEVAGPWATMTPSEAALKFFEQNPRTGGKTGNSRQKSGKAWVAKTREQFKLPALLLEQVMEGRPLATVTHDDLVTLNGCFEKLHGPTFRKSPRHREMTIREIVTETERKVTKKELTNDEIGLGLTTTNRHWGFLRQLTDWFHGHLPLAKLDYSAFIEKDGSNPRDQREVYTEEQGTTLFNLPPWTGSKSITRRMEPGRLIYHDAWYFVVIIAWYTGMRREEICGLELDDIECDDGCWQFQVRPNSIRKLKTAGSKRILPFADELLRLGLPEYAIALRDAGERLLFPELAPESGIGTMGDAYYDLAWTKLAKALPFLRRGQALQSFRHTAINSMKAAGITPEIRADFAGHRLKSETEGRYSKAHLILIREAVATIPEVTKHLDPAPLKLLPARLRAPRKARPT